LIKEEWRGHDPYNMKFKVTIPGAILGLIVFVVVALQSVGKYYTGKWSGTVGIVVASVGAAMGLALAFTATSASYPVKSSPADADASTPTVRAPWRQFRNSILLWAAAVVIFLLMFRLLDALHINWRARLN
jgi:NADH:ubiquinone oxidoreductase subunit 6 (subunit J)